MIIATDKKELRVDHLGKKYYQKFTDVIKFLAENKDDRGMVVKEITDRLKCMNHQRKLGDRKMAKIYLNSAWVLMAKYKKLVENK